MLFFLLGGADTPVPTSSWEAGVWVFTSWDLDAWAGWEEGVIPTQVIRVTIANAEPRVTISNLENAVSITS